MSGSLDFPYCALVVAMDEEDAIKFTARLIRQNAWFFCEQYNAQTLRFYVSTSFYPIKGEKVFKGLQSLLFVKLHNPKLQF